MVTTTGITTVDKIFVINLDSNVDRLNNFIKIMKSLNYNFERFKAINGNTYTPEYLTPGEYGCFLSHCELWKRVAQDKQINKAIIFEDDVKLSDKLENCYHAKVLIEHYITKYNYDLFYLGKCLDRCDKHISQGPGVVRSFEPLCAHAYVITKGAAIKLLKFIEQQSFIKYPVDVLLNKCISEKELLVYAAHPSIFVQDTICFSSNLRNKLDSFFNTKECCIPKYAAQLYIFIFLVSLLFIVITIIWIYYHNQRRSR